MPGSDLAAIRTDYILRSLDEKDVLPDPFSQFHLWISEALEAVCLEPTAMTLATSSPDGEPFARIVLLKGADEKGLYFYTNYGSDKGRQLEANPKAAAVFLWAELERQVRVKGMVAKVTPEESDKYFNSRPEDSRISASVSPQSHVVPDRKYLENLFAIRKNALAGNVIERPDNWGGYVIKPYMFEFWQGRKSRLHDRIRYSLIEGKWKIERLAP